MAVIIEPLLGKDAPVGTAFVSYSREDEQDVKNVIESNFKTLGIPYFRDVKDIAGGAIPIEELDKALDGASCGVIVLSPKSVESKWVWFEAGVLIGRGKPVIPFLIKTYDKEGFIKNLPEFIRRYQVVQSVDDLIKAVRGYVFEFGNLFGDPHLNKKIMPQLKQAKVTITLRIPEDIKDILKFGYLLIRFGREDVIGHPANVPLLEEGGIINKAVFAKAVGYDKREEILNVEYLLPVHEKLGVKFKPFVDVHDLSKIHNIVSTLKANGFSDVAQSGSAEKQRIYFLLHNGISIVKSPDGILDNYLKGKLDNYLYPI